MKYVLDVLLFLENNVDCNNHTINCTAETTIEYAQPGEQVRILNLYCTAQTTIEYAQPGEQVSFQKNITYGLINNLMFCFTDFESLNEKLLCREPKLIGSHTACFCI